jgi:hypothetical protein
VGALQERRELASEFDSFSGRVRNEIPRHGPNDSIARPEKSGECVSRDECSFLLRAAA